MAVGNGAKQVRKPQKTLKIVKDDKFPNMLRLQFEEGGKLPEVLSGMYGGYPEAQRAIDNWMEGHTRDKIYPKAPANDKPSVLKPKETDKGKVEKDGEAKSTS